MAAEAALRLRRSGAMASFKSPFKWIDLGSQKAAHGGLLDPFLTIRESTGGLGLSLAYGMIKEHGGKMAVHSIPGEGATYVVELPIREPLPSTFMPPSDELEIVGRRRVLVVDADEENLALLQEVVHHLGHDADGSLLSSRGIAENRRSRL